ncbi:MAG: hypothetical protein COA79_12400 [Planctomycetota bacterium]|nr:MAG: hypothetical protein COA79_12400 [Planctomycetota bacterium]
MTELKNLSIQLAKKYSDRPDLHGPLIKLITKYSFPQLDSKDKPSILEMAESITTIIKTIQDYDTKHQLTFFLNEVSKEAKGIVAQVLQSSDQKPIDLNFQNNALNIHPSYLESAADFKSQKVFENLSQINQEILFIKKQDRPQLNNLLNQLEKEKSNLLAKNSWLIDNLLYCITNSPLLDELPNSSELKNKIFDRINSKSKQSKDAVKEILSDLDFTPSRICDGFKHLDELKNNQGVYFIKSISELFNEYEHEIVNYLVYSNSVQSYQILSSKSLNWNNHTAALTMLNLKFPESLNQTPQKVIGERFNQHKKLVNSIEEYIQQFPLFSIVDIILNLNLDDGTTKIENIIPAPKTLTAHEFLGQRNVTPEEKSLILNTPENSDNIESIDALETKEGTISKAAKFAADILLDKPDISAIEKIPLASVKVQSEEFSRRQKDFIQNTNTIWHKHVQPFIKQNIFPLVASICIFIGVLSLIVAFWDKSPFIRYLATPLSILLAGLGLHKIGNWLYQLDEKSKTPASILKALSLFLAPLSFIMVSILSTDPEISLMVKFVATPLLAIGLLVGWRIVFKSSMNLINPIMQKPHTISLLILNGLLLLLPIYYYADNHITDNLILSKSILVLGFYLGFGFLFLKVKGILKEFYKDEAITSQLAPLFFIITTIGTYITVWGITHIRLNELPEAFTYSILVCFFGLMTYVIEFYIRRKNRLTTLSYVGTSFLILGNLLAIFNPTIRPIVLLVTASIWFYQAHHRKDERHYTISIILVLCGITSFAFYKDFPTFLFPYLIALQALSLIFTSKKFKIFKNIIPIIFYPFVIIGTLISLYFTWTQPTLQIISALGLILLSGLIIYKANQDKQIEQIHTGLLISITALPFLGLADTINKIYLGNILLFGFSMLGFLWIGLCYHYKESFLVKARSTGLFIIAIIAFCVLLVNLSFGPDPLNSDIRQYLVMAGPILLSVIFFINGFKTRSQIPVYLGLFTLVFIFPEIKNHYNIVMKSGLGSAVSMAFMLAIAYGLKHIKQLKDLDDGDMILDKTPFPLHKKDHRLFTEPLILAALVLIARTVFKSYPVNIYHGYFDNSIESADPFEIKTLFALAIQSVGLLFYTLWYKKSIFTYIGLALSFITAIHFSHFINIELIAIYMLVLFFCWEGLSYISQRKNISDNLIQSPIRNAFLLAMIAFTFILYPLYTLNDFQLPHLFAVPLYLFFIFKSYRFNISKPCLPHITILFLLCWQTFILVSTNGMSILSLMKPDSPFYLFSFIFISLWALPTYYFEFKKQESLFRYFYQSLFLPLIICLIITVHYIKMMYLPGYVQLELVTAPFTLVVATIALILLARLIRISFNWLWITLIVYALFISFIFPDISTAMIYHPIALTVLIISTNIFSFLITKFDHYFIPKIKAPLIIQKLPSTQLVLTIFGQLIKLSIVFYLIWVAPFKFTPFTTVALYLIAITSIQDAKFLKISKAFYFWLFFTFTNIYLVLALNNSFPDFRFFKHLHINHLIAIGLFISLLIAVVFDKLKFFKDNTNKSSFYLIKYVAAASIPFLIFIQYCLIRNINIPWERSVVSAALALGSALYLRYMVPDQDKQKSYGLFTFSLSISIFCIGLLILEKVMKIEMTPMIAFAILALSPFWFAIKAELNFKNNNIHNSARDAAQILLTLLMGFYVYQNIFDIFFLPGTETSMTYYFQNAFVCFIASVLMWRTHKMKGHSAIPYLSISMMLISLFFMFNNFTPINLTINPAMSCYTAIILGVIIWLNIENDQPLYNLLKNSAKLSDEEWVNIKSIIHTIVIIGSHILFLLALFEGTEDNNAALILVGLASLWSYLGISKRKTRFLHLAFFYLLLVCLIIPHTSKFIPDHLTVLLLTSMLAGLLITYQIFLKNHFIEQSHKIVKVIVTWSTLLFTIIFFISFLEIGNHKNIILTLLATSWLLVLCSPFINKNTSNVFEKMLVLSFMNLPCLILAQIFHTGLFYNVIVLLLSITSINLGVYLLDHKKKSDWSAKHKSINRFGSYIIVHYFQPTTRYARISLYMASTISLAIQLIYFATSYSSFQNSHIIYMLFLHALTQLLLIAFLFLEAKRSQKVIFMVIAELIYFSFYMQMRLALPVAFNIIWDSAYDVYFLMIQSFIVVSLHSIIQKQESYIQKPINFSILGFPILTIMLCMYFNIDQNLMMHTLLFYSGIFIWQSYNERSRFILSYAFLGLNAYVLLQLFHNHIHSVQAYVAPLCITLLIYSQMFRDRTSKTTANILRTISLIAILGTSGWEIIAKNLTSPSHHAILIILCSAAIYFAAVFKAKIYAVIGSTVFLLDIGTIIYLLVKNQDKNMIIISLGLLLTIGGSILLGGYIYYRKNEKAIDEKIEKLKSLIKRWD